MTIMSRSVRQYIGIIAAIIIYYIIHEGAHLLVSFYYGVFKQINFMGLGVQVDVYHTLMTDIQMGIFCLAGAIATLVFSWLLIIFCKPICSVKSKVFRTIAWYTSLVMLLLDPLYLSVLCGFFGGGDMNGILLLWQEWFVRALFAGIGIVHALVIFRYLLPKYTKSFSD
ncbi:hypothetical protein A8L44_06680 [Bacillus sp. FJAT-27986]|nr:hypothetical protein A8L44_06680 [Bacillus sp. FJAT-27986]